MSLVSIYANKDIIAEKIAELKSMPFDGDWQLASYVISECMSKQYEMMRNNLNANMLKKRHFDAKLKGKELLDALYQHIYSHNHIALTDEIYEVRDAYMKLYGTDHSKIDGVDSSGYLFQFQCTEDTASFLGIQVPKKVKLSEEIFMRELLVLEEYIDTFHFILEYTALLEEHYLLSLTDEAKLTMENMDFYYVGQNRFSRQVNELIKNEGSHIISYLFEHKLLRFNDDNMNGNDEAVLLNGMSRVNREFIRNCNFKDWKNYPPDFYSPGKFAELFSLNREMYAYCINGISLHLDTMSVLLDLPTTDLLKHNSLRDTMTVMYGLYMAKREENIRRQNNDPRYTGKTEGEIVGVKVE